MRAMFADKSGFYPVRVVLAAFAGTVEKIAAGIAGVPAGAVHGNMGSRRKITTGALNLRI